jgi:hypothetical protein
MTFPSGSQVSTTELDSGSGSPANARAQILSAMQNLNLITAEVNTIGNVVVLDSAGQVPSTSIPQNITPSNNLTLAPTTGVVKIEDYLRMQIVTKATVLALTTQTIGDIVFVADDLTGTNAKLCMYNGTVWKIIGTLSSLTTLT